MSNTTNAFQTVGEIAASDLRKADILRKFGIDFCCGGKKSLSSACEQAGVAPAVVEAALSNPEDNTPAAGQNAYNRWEPDFLADYIYNQHHLYYYEQGPLITSLLEKVCAAHGSRHPSLVELKALFHQLAKELETHFETEEKLLFPYIKAIMNARRTNDNTQLAALSSVSEPVRLMELEHEAAGEILSAIRKITNNFELPADACNSFRLLYKKLETLEADLHQHVHLENNILFPKALQLDSELKKILVG